MRNKNWQKVERIFHKALSYEGEERQKYIERACSDDCALIIEIKSLLGAFEDEGQLLETPVLDLGLSVIHQKTRKTRAHTRAGFYEIREKLGSGGMGDVYEAIDTKLHRRVALKFLSESLKNDNAAKRQLSKEAQAVAMLEHPNICAVYGIEQIEDDNFIVMQFIDGVTLENRIESMPVNADMFKSLARQITSAVAFAHSHGVIHRDLKPGNIMLSNDGNIKVLDFGLAKVVEQPIFESEISRHPSHFSQNGLIIGTVSYMSPEQLRGEKLDYQSDIFSLGIVLFELFARRNPFQRQTQAETIAAILSDGSVSETEVNLKSFPRIANLIAKCLEKDKGRRFQSVAEIIVELDKIENEVSSETVSRRRGKLFAPFFLPVIIFLLLGPVTLYYKSNFIKEILPSSKPKQTLAVLPIQTDSANAANEYLAYGLTQSLIDKLSALSSLKVENENFVSRFKGKNIAPEDAGRELGVDFVFTGKIYKKENIPFLETKLIRISDDFILDTGELPLDETDLNDLQEKITSAIIGKTVLILSPEEKIKLAKKDTENPAAKKLYFLGRFYLNRRKEDDPEKAAQYFREATDLDPLYAKAWAGLADTFTLYSLPGYKRAIPPEESLFLAKAAAKSALDIDDTLCEPYVSLGLIKLRYEWEWQSAENYFRAAISRDPEFSQAHLGLSNLYIIEGRFDEAIQESLKAREFAPFAVSSDAQLATAYYFKRDYQNMSKILVEALEKNPNHKRLMYLLGFQLFQTGKMKEATEVFEKIYAENKLLGSAPLGLVYGETGRRAEARKILANLETLSADNYVPAQERGFIYLGLGKIDKVFESLNQACKERFSAFPAIIQEPVMDKIKSDPRFEAIRKCANL